MLAPTRVFLQSEKKLQAGDLPACNFLLPPEGAKVFFAVPCLLLPGQRDLLAGDGQLIEPLVGGVVDRIGHGGQRGVDDHLADALGTEGAGALVAALKYDMDMPDVVARGSCTASASFPAACRGHRR